ncbi:beta-ketoacyl-ACP synthase II [Chitinispirillales bacterium ANBcel5]|uniref:beta-ketoacyl-ACP synthase II n=1 Tax=Cellulosispirillum alkaliphilum TaxID=3039283 RepID=UPI002A52E709|nr:beta-ketoacyl-ACP synthase II [Chitinispirillales bacterium ANBcel5]
MSKRVVVTGLGVTSPVGNNIETFWSALCAGKSGLGDVTLFDASKYTCRIAGEVKEIDFSHYVDLKEVKRTDRVILLALAAARMALQDSGLDLDAIDRDRAGVIVGSGIGGLRTLENEHAKMLSRGPGRVSPFLVPMMITDMPAGRVSMAYGLKGPNYAVVSACASAGHSIGDAWMAIKSGMMDVAVTGGSEAGITPISFAGFCSMKAMSTRNDEPQKASCPFDSKRDGFVMGEGSGIIVLESLEHAKARGAKIYAELVGYGATGDAYHLSHPAPDGVGAQSAIKMALKSANVEPSKVDYINAHGTSTPLNDKYESIAIKKVFGEHASKLNISSTKSMTGHLLGASGGIEFIASVLAIRDGVVPPTINYEDPDPECDLNYTPNTAAKKEITYAMSNSFGFGGHNASLLIGRYDSSEANN